MTKEFIPYEQALELKELGFDEPCFGYYDIKDNNLQLFSDNLQDASCNSDLKYDDFKHCTAPLYQQVFRWFREKYSLNHEISYAGKSGQYHAFVKEYAYSNNGNNPSVFTYEEAELECLIKLIEITKTK
jgi:hypothetical protein